jgi:TonB family protein
MLLRLIPLLCVFSLLTQISNAQKVKEWLDHNWEPLPAGQQGPYYRMVRKDTNDIRHGLVISYYAEGKPRMVGNFKHGYLFGPFTYYFPDGQVEAKGNYKADYRFGFWEEWYPDGKLRQQTNHVEEQLGNGQVLLVDRIENFWDSTGNQLVQAGTGHWYSLYENGKVFQQGRLASFRKDGQWLEYTPEGRLERKEFFSDQGLQSGIYYGPGGSYAYTAGTYETMPEFPGGLKALEKFILKRLHYPAGAEHRQITGTVFVGFVVGADGKVSDITILKGIGGGCNEESARVVALLPAWTPARQRGKAVAMRFSLPVRFLSDNSPRQEFTLGRGF